MSESRGTKILYIQLSKLLYINPKYLRSIPRSKAASSTHQAPLQHLLLADTGKLLLFCVLALSLYIACENIGKMQVWFSKIAPTEQKWKTYSRVICLAFSYKLWLNLTCIVLNLKGTDRPLFYYCFLQCRSKLALKILFLNTLWNWWVDCLG